MLRKISDLIIHKRIAILVLMLVLAAAGAAASFFIPVNEDMAKYLPADSGMKAGMDIMEAEFPAAEADNTIRVMFSGLTDADRQEVLQSLTALENVRSVDYDAGSADYNRDGRTLYVIHMACEYGSAGQRNIEAALKTQFGGRAVWHDDEESVYRIPLIVFAAAILLIFVILFVMCASWAEPFLFLASTGIAILINAGTNFIVGSVAAVTHSIAALLQMVLAMDYSVIVMNRYRKERETEPDRFRAMKNAWVNAFPSVAASSLTTVVGLLTLVFMRFKIGENLGIVLAKGVFISMICSLTVLPALILIFDGLLARSVKKVPLIPTGGLSKFSYRMRYVLSGLFLVLFGLFLFLQSRAGIAYTIVRSDAVAEVFPKKSTLAVVYDNRDEERIGSLIGRLEADSRVRSVTAFATTLGKAYTAEELAEEFKETDGGLSLAPAVIRMLYCDYYNGGKTGTMTAGEFLTFLTDKVLDDEAFAEYVTDDIRENADLIRRFSDAETLQKPMTADELADFFDLAPSDARDLFLLYQIETGAPADGTMTLPVFADFVINEVAADPVYGAMFDEEALSGLSRLAAFTDAEKMTAPLSPEEIAALLGIDAGTARLLFLCCGALSDPSDPGTMTLPEFVAFLQTAAQDPALASYLGKETLQQLGALSAFTDKAILQAPQDPAGLAALLGADESTVNTLFVLYTARDLTGRTMTLPEFTGFLTGYLLSDPAFSAALDDDARKKLTTLDALIQLAASRQPLGPAQMAQTLGMDEAAVSQLYFLYLSARPDFQQEVAQMTMTMPEFLALLKTTAPEEQQEQLVQMESLILAATSETEMTAAELAAVTGLPEQQTAQILAAQSAEKMTLAAFLNAAAALAPDPQLLQLQQLVQLAASSMPLNAAALAQTFGLDQSQVFQLFGLTLAPQKTIPLADFTAFLANNVLSDEATAASFSEEEKAQLSALNSLIQLAASGAPLDPASAAAALGLDEATAAVVYRLYFGRDISATTLSLKEAVDFILADPVMQSYLDAETLSRLQMTQQMIQAVEYDVPLDPASLAQILSMDEASLRLLFALRASAAQQQEPALSVRTLVDFLAANRETLGPVMGAEQLDQLTAAQAIIHGTVDGTAYPSDRLAALTGMTADRMRRLYLLYTAKHGDTSSWTLSARDFIDFIAGTVAPDAQYADRLDADALSRLSSAQILTDAVTGGKALTAEEMSGVLRGLSDDADTSQIELLYLYAESLDETAPARTMTLETLFRHLKDNVLNDPRFASFLDDGMRRSILEGEAELTDGKKQLVGASHSRLIVTSTYPDEGAETTAFLSGLEDCAKNTMTGRVHLVGNSALAYEVQQIFDKELTLITLITAAAIFLIVLLTFRSFIIPAILVLLVQCGVFITVTVTGILSGGMYYLALLIVECILMGATIDYGMLFTNHYREYRRTLDVPKALAAAYRVSIHTIMTSGLVLVLVTAAIALGRLFEDETVTEIVRTISVGAFCAILLILFILPGILAACDKLVVRKKER